MMEYWNSGINFSSERRRPLRHVQLRYPCRAFGLAAFCSLFLLNASAQYIGFVYPAGGQRGTTIRITLGGQKLEGVDRVIISGSGVTGKIVEYNKKMSNQEVQIISEQLQELKRKPAAEQSPAITNMISKIERVMFANTPNPACASIANLVIAEVTFDPNAPPGQREIRLCTKNGISNPLVFNVGQLPELAAEPMVTAPLVTLGKEEQSLRRKKREQKSSGSEMMMEGMMMEGMMMGSAGIQSDLDDEEVLVKLPCTLNGQIAQGSVDRYRFLAKKGQKLVVVVQARELVPFMADAVPGWFQPVLVLCNSRGKEVAYVDDYQFKPDPVMLCEIPEDDVYHLAIYDSLYRGREDFVYRITLGEIPFVTSFFPLGSRVGETTKIDVKGWNLDETQITPDLKDVCSGVYPVSVRGQGGLLLSNPLPFAKDTLPECFEKEPNSQLKTAQKVALPVIINGRIDLTSKKDLFQFEGRSNTVVVAEVTARRLNSPLDSIIKLTDTEGKILAMNDDREDEAAGINTHHADSYIAYTLPKDGTYVIHLTDTQNKGGEDYNYRLRISEPLPDFDLRLVPSMVTIKSNSTATLKVYALRRDGFTNAISFRVKGESECFSAQGKMNSTQTVSTITIKTKLGETPAPARLVIEGVATNGTQEWIREAVPSEDRMQAFLWRHLVPAQELRALVYNPPPPPPRPAKTDKKEPPKPEPKKVDFPQGMLVHYNFDQWEANGMITDRTGRSNAGKASNTKWSSGGKQAGGYELTLTNSYIIVKDTPLLNPKTITLALWVKVPGTTAPDRYLFEKQKENGYALCIAGNENDPARKGLVKFIVNNKECWSDTPVTDAAWHHVMARYDGHHLKLAVDGKPQTNSLAWEGEITANTNSISIGMNRTDPVSQEKRISLGGMIDDVMIFDHAIKDDEVGVVIASTKPKFSKGQVMSRLNELKELLGRELLTQDFYDRKVKECEVNL
jgi:Concanavalin A-like lectin/glucanases superfamily